MVKLGIVGTGYTIGIGKNHVKAYRRMPDVEITALYDVIPGQAKKWAKENELNEKIACDTYEELLSKVDAVIICTPNYLHADQAMQAMEAGKHVLCEKPFSTDLKTCKKAVEYAKTTNLVNMIGFCYRGIPAIKYIKKLIDSGKLGKVFYLRQTLGGNRLANPQEKLEWRMQEDLAGSGALADFGSHVIDLADFLLKDISGKITELSCTRETYIEEREKIGENIKDKVTNDDLATFQGKTEQNTIISGLLSRVGGEHLLELSSEGAYIKFNGKNPCQLEVMWKDIDGGYHGELEILEIPEEFYKTDEYIPEIKSDIGFYEQSRAFIDAIKTGVKLERDLERGEYIQYIISKLILADKTACRVKLE